MASPQLVRKRISPSVSGRPISLLYLQDRLTSAQKLPRNEADKEALLWLCSRAHFFLPLLPLGLAKLVWAAYQGPREPHQSAWISSVVFGVCGVAGRRLLLPPTCSDHLHVYGAAPRQATHTLTLPEGLLGSENLVRRSSLSKHGAPQPDRLLPYPPASWCNQRGDIPLLQLYLESHVHLLLTENMKQDVMPKDEYLCTPLSTGAGTFRLAPFSFTFQYNFEHCQIKKTKQAEEQETPSSLGVFCMDRPLSVLQNITHRI